MSRSRHHIQHSQPKLKPPPRALFSCGIFRNCTHSALSPTTPPPSSAFLPSSSPAPPAAETTNRTYTPPTLPPASPPPPSPPPPRSGTPDTARAVRPPPSTSSSSSSSSSTSQSFTQWRFPLDHTHQHQQQAQQQAAEAAERHVLVLDAAVASSLNLAEAFHAAELNFASGARIPALRLLERSLARDATPPSVTCPLAVMAGVIEALRDAGSARPATKVLLALLLSEQNRRTAVEAGAVSAAVEAVSTSGPAGATAERGLAALELLCTVTEGAEEVRGHAAALPALAGAAEGMVGRGRECAIGVMAAIYGDCGAEGLPPPPEVGRAVMTAMQGECSARARRKGAQLLRALQESGRLDIGAAVDGF